MKIDKIMIRNFGKIHDKSLELGDGINVLYGENESGKTTIHTFLKGMFFGISRSRGRAAKKDVYSTYEPWENPAEYGGTMWFSQGKHAYRLTRNFEQNHQRFELVEEDGGRTWDDPEALTELLGEVSEAVYDNTVSVGQLKSVTGTDLVHELKNYIASYEGTGDTSLDLGRASQMLKMSRKGFQVQADRTRKELVKEQEKLDVGIDYLEKEIDSLSDKHRQIDEKKKSLRLGDSGGDVLERHIRDAKKKKTLTMLLLGAAAVLFVLLGLVLTDTRMKIGSAAAGVVLLLIGIFRNRQLQKEIRRRRRMKEKWMAKNKKVRSDKGAVESAIQEKRRQIESVQVQREELEEQLRDTLPEELEIDAINLAMETIEALSSDMSNQVGRQLHDRTSRILSEITNGKYRDVRFDEAFQMTVNTGDRMVPLEGLSRGTLEQIYFSLRMAAGELFLGPEPFPVILDDIFGMYDEERLSGVLRWLHHEKRQIIISTCSRRELEILEKEQIPYRGLLL